MECSLSVGINRRLVSFLDMVMVVIAVRLFPFSFHPQFGFFAFHLAVPFILQMTLQSWHILHRSTTTPA